MKFDHFHEQLAIRYRLVWVPGLTAGSEKNAIMW